MIEIGNNVQTERKTELDLKKLVNGRTFISGMTDSGKSWTVRKLCEEVFGKVGIIILDPEGEYTSLREKYPFLIIGKDIPLEIESAEFLAEQTLKEGISVIIDFSTTDVIDQQEFTAKFLDKFMELETKLKKAYLVVVEECDEFAPEKGVFKSGSLRSIVNVAKKGRKRGIGLVVATQRPAFVSKYVISQCQNKAIGHTEWTGDLKVIKDFLQIDEEIISKISKSKKGEFYFSGDFIEENQFIKVGMVQTTHSGETPDIVPLKSSQLRTIIQKLSLSLPKTIEDIKPSIPDTKELESKITLKIEREHKTKILNLEREIKGLKAQGISEEEIQKRIDEATDNYIGKIQEKDSELNKFRKFIASIVAKGNQFLGEEGDELIQEHKPALEVDYDIWLNKFKGGKRTILELIVKHRKLTKAQLTIMSGLKRSNITHNILPILKSAGLINYNQEYIELIER